MKSFYLKPLWVVCLLSITMLCACGGTPATSNGPAQTEISAEPTAKVVSWQEQYDLGVRYLTEGNYKEAILAFTAAIEIDPKQAVVYVGRGDAYAALAATDSAYYSDAIADYRTAVEQDSSQPEVYLKLGDIYRQTDEQEEAINAYSAALELDNEMMEAYIGRGGIYLDMAERLKAESDELEQAEGESEEEYTARKEALIAERNAYFENAKEDYLQALELDPQQPELYDKTADIYLALDDFNSAVDLLEKGAELTGDEALRQRLDELMKDRSRVVTVSGEVFSNMEVYRAQYFQLLEQYGYVTDENGQQRYAKMAIDSDGIRFAEPVEVDINGETVIISEAHIVGHWMGQEGSYSLTGYFTFFNAEVIGPFTGTAPNNPYLEYIYHPNGPYAFFTSEGSPSG